MSGEQGNGTMALVLPHKCFLFEKATGNTSLLIDSRGPISPLPSTHVIFQTDPALILARLLTQRFLIFYCRAIHLLARCDRSGDPSACITRRHP